MELSDFGLDEKTMEEILTISVLEIKGRGQFEPLNEDGTPKQGSLLDPRLEESFGHIVLARPVKPIDMVRLQLPVKQITTLPVPPISIRRNAEGGMKRHHKYDDVTWALMSISSMNARLGEMQEILANDLSDGSAREIADMMEELLEYYISTYLDNQLGEYYHSKRGIVRKFAPGVYQYCFPEDSSRKWNGIYKSSRVKELEERFKNMNT